MDPHPLNPFFILLLPPHPDLSLSLPPTNRRMTTQETSPLLGHSASGAGNSYRSTPHTRAPTTTTTTTGQQEALSQRHQESKGLIYMILSAFFFSFMSLLVSITARSLPSFEVLLFRGIIQTLGGIAVCRYLNISPWGNRNVRFLLFCRGLAGTCALGFFFFALSVLPLADATTIFFLGPVFTAILGRIVLKEPFGPLDALASTISMIGVILVAKPTALFSSPPTGGAPDAPKSLGWLAQWNSPTGRNNGEDHRLLGALCAVCGAMCTATVRHTTKKLSWEKWI
jgi:drug/metabolite transporter (DMT)-like permease